MPSSRTPPPPLRLCVPKNNFRVQKNTCVAKACVEIPTTSHVFLTRITRIFRNCHPAHLDKTDHRFAMGGYHGNSTPISLVICTQRSHRASLSRPNGEGRGGATSFFLTRITRKFRNYHSAHFDKSDHRVAMGGCHGNLLPFSPILHSSSGHRPSAYPIPLLPHRRCATLNSLRLCVKLYPPCVKPPPLAWLFFNTDNTEISELPFGTF